MKIKAPSHGTCVAYLALFMAMSGTAVAATGGTFILGRGNVASAPTTLKNAGFGPSLALPAARAGQPPLGVSANAGKVANLNVDRLDGLDASAFARAFNHGKFQQRVFGTCPSGQAMVGVNGDGSVACAQLAPPPPAPAPAQFRDKGFAISDLQISRDALDDWDGIARITNETSTTRSGGFTVTIFRNGSIVATLGGSVSGLAAGGTNTVDFSSTDDFTDGEFTTTFQTDYAH